MRSSTRRRTQRKRVAYDDDTFTPECMLTDYAWLLRLIHVLRPDLGKLFPRNKKILQFLAWLICNGTKEYAALRESPAFRDFLLRPLPGLGITLLQSLIYYERRDVRQAFPLPSGRDAFVAWFYTHGVREHTLWPFLSAEDSDYIRKNFPETAQHIPVSSPAVSGVENKPFGVNIIGYVYGQLGIGEDARMTARALQAVKVPFVMINFPPGKDIPQNDYSMHEYVQEYGVYRSNIFCMTALETGRFYMERGKEQFSGKYNIGYWPWELSRWPAEWKDMFSLVDEVWVASRHIYDAVAPVSPVPVLHMPLAVDVGDVSDTTRAEFGLPEDDYLFCFSFDFNSSMHRKNPQACLEAFMLAFPGGESWPGAGLVIKAHRPSTPAPAWDTLKKAANRDGRIHIIEETLSRADTLALYRACDCYISLHRAEGFGRGIAEALLLGLRVIATGYSGNMDFCAGDQALVTPYVLRPVAPDHYPFAKKQVWADADLQQAAVSMRQCVRMGRVKSDAGYPGFAPQTVGERYKERLRIIGENF